MKHGKLDCSQTVSQRSRLGTNQLCSIRNPNTNINKSRCDLQSNIEHKPIRSIGKIMMHKVHSIDLIARSTDSKVVPISIHMKYENPINIDLTHHLK